jgi:hypothetical protein
MHAPTPELVKLYAGPLDGLDVELSAPDLPALRLSLPLRLAGGELVRWEVSYARDASGGYTFIPEASPLPFD